MLYTDYITYADVERKISMSISVRILAGSMLYSSAEPDKQRRRRALYKERCHYPGSVSQERCHYPGSVSQLCNFSLDCSMNIHILKCFVP